MVEEYALLVRAKNDTESDTMCEVISGSLERVNIELNDFRNKDDYYLEIAKR